MMAKHFSSILTAGEGRLGGQVSDPKQQHTSVVVNMSARVGSISGKLTMINCTHRYFTLMALDTSVLPS